MMKRSNITFLYPRGSSESRKDQLAKVFPPIIYKYTSSKRAEDILTGQCLKFSPPETFNDPFDMYEKLIDFTCTEEELEHWVNTECAHFPAWQRKRRFEEIKSEGLDKFAVDSLEIFKKLKEASGVCCFSEEKDVDLMWSHYAQEHTGVCFGFDFHPLSDYRGISMSLLRVNYLNQIKPVNYHDSNIDAVNYWISSKSGNWSYEKEIRALIVNRLGNDLFPFDKACLKEIYFGCRTPASVRETLLNLIAQKGYKVSIKQQMVIDDSTFSIKPVDF